MDRGCDISIKISVRVKFNEKSVIIISESSLNKILILEIKDNWLIFSEVLKAILFLVYKTNIFIKLLKL